MHRRRLATSIVALAVATTALVAIAQPSAARPKVDRDASAIVRWNEITERTINENAVPVPASSLYYAFAALAAYDAVVAIEGRYEPWMAQPRPKAHASPSVAAITASHRVLRHFFPSSAAALDADYAASLAAIPNGVGKVHGQWVGQAAADALIAARSADGRGATVAQPGDGDPGPGEWRPTPDAFAPMAVPWLGFVHPLVLPSATTVTLDGPDPITSSAYAADFAEVKDLGGVVSQRTDEQTRTALFWNANPVRQYNAAVRDQVVRRGLDIVESARTFALLHSSSADALIACWHSKYVTNYWRPVTAIRLADTDGNDATVADPEWRSHALTPPYSEYPSGHACVTGATTRTLEHLFGSALTPALSVPSFVAGVPNRTYATTSGLDAEAINARIWLGFHFRDAMDDGNALGRAVAQHAATHSFRPSA